MRKLPQLVMVLPLIASLYSSAQDAVTIKETSGDPIFLLPMDAGKLNITDKADAYPFLSADGLRLYFTSNREGGHGRFFVSERTSLAEPFGQPRVLSTNLTDGYFAGSFTADERTICMVKSGKVYISKRKDLNDEFAKPVEIKGFPEGFLCGPSISPDGSEIIITVSNKDGYSTRIFRQQNEYEYHETGRLHIPEGFVIGPGQLSKDGLSYYFSFGNTLNYNSSLWRYTRTSLRSDFTLLEELPKKINSYNRNLQPSFSADGSVMAYVKAETNQWNDDEIVLVNLEPTTNATFTPATRIDLPVTEITEPAKEVTSPAKEIIKSTDKTVAKPVVIMPGISVKTYPNPIHSNVILELDQQPEAGTLFVLYDLNGRIITQRTISARITRIEMNALTPSGYFYKLINNKNEAIASGKLIKN